MGARAYDRWLRVGPRHPKVAFWTAQPYQRAAKHAINRPFTAATPAERLPCRGPNDRIGYFRQRIGGRIIAWSSMDSNRKAPCDIIGINLLMFGNPDSPERQRATITSETPPIGRSLRQVRHLADPPNVLKMPIIVNAGFGSISP